MVFLVDSHVNLHGEKFAGDLDEVVSRARSNDVSVMLNICCDISGIDQVIDVAERYENMWASVGTHPHEARHNPDIKAEDILKYCSHPKIIGVGETGLDFHYNYSSREDQFANFRAHIEAARESQLPLIVHTREADDEMADLLEAELSKGAFPVLLHCYSSGAELAARAAAFGAWFAVSGIITFKNAHELREIVADMPGDRIMLETDCPYLAPVPHRGRRNEPAYVSEVGQKLAEIKGWDYEDMATRTTDAFFNLFSKAVRPGS